MFKNKQTKSAEFGNVNIQCRIYIPNSKRQLLNKYFGHNRYNTVHDRDFNAANNILTEGKRLLAI